MYLNKTILFLLIITYSCSNEKQNEVHIKHVYAAMETDPVESSDDTADDACIWVHPTDRSLSLIIGTDKHETSAGLRVYNLDGAEVFQTEVGRMNNVDIRYGFDLGDETVDMVTAGERISNTLGVFKIDLESRTLVDIAARDLNLGISVYGSCMYKNRLTGDVYAIVNDKEGNVEQYKLFDNGSGLVDALLVRTLKLPGKLEGCVADDILGHLYIGEEDHGIWKYQADPNGSDAGILIDSIGPHIVADVEGLTIYYSGDTTGYLIASSQGDNSYAIYSREGENHFIGRFSIVDSEDIDGTSGTDGIDVCNMNLGGIFSSGIFVVQDGSNNVGSMNSSTSYNGNQNFKAVPWGNIAFVFNPPLEMNTNWDIRYE